MRPLPRVTAEAKVSPQAIIAAMASLDPAQTLNSVTHAVHGAGFWTEREGLVASARMSVAITRSTSSSAPSSAMAARRRMG